MTDRSLVYEIKLPIDFTCHPGGGIDVHFVILEVPEGASIRSAPPMTLPCWPVLSDHVMTTQLSRLVERASAPIEGFTEPTDTTPAGTDLGFLKSDYQDSLYDAKWEPYLDEEDKLDEMVATSQITRLVCPDGAPPVAHADPFGNITYRCRDGSAPSSVPETILATVNSPLNIPHFNDVPAVEQVTIPRVQVRSQEVWLNIPLPAVGCCTPTTTAAPTTTTTVPSTTSSGPTV